MPVGSADSITGFDEFIYYLCPPDYVFATDQGEMTTIYINEPRAGIKLKCVDGGGNGTYLIEGDGRDLDEFINDNGGKWPMCRQCEL